MNAIGPIDSRDGHLETIIEEPTANQAKFSAPSLDRLLRKNQKGLGLLTGKFSSRTPTIIGWREHISLPELGIPWLAVKIDTGARTSALHAVEQKFFERDGVQWVSFVVPGTRHREKRRVEAKVVDDREIKNTSGKPERRIVIKTTIGMTNHTWRIETSLADRGSMKFDMILGRTAIRGRGLLVDPGKSFLLPPHSSTDAVES